MMKILVAPPPPLIFGVVVAAQSCIYKKCSEPQQPHLYRVYFIAAPTVYMVVVVHLLILK